jgi:drug/metabolite transporter (DMT)-like permease
LGPILAAITTLFIWGGTAIANKYAVGFMDALTAGVLRSMLAGLAAMAICLIFRLKFPRENKHRVLLLISGLSSFAVWPAMMSVGIQLTTASHAGLIMAVLPVLTVLINAVTSRVTPIPAWWVGASLALLGAAYLSLEQVGIGASASATNPMLGDLIIFGGCIVCSAGYVAGGKLSPFIGTIATTFWGLTVALVVLVPVFILQLDSTDWNAIPGPAWAAIAWMAVLSSLVGYALWFYALGKGGIARIGTLQFMMPIITLAGAVLILGEQWTLNLGVVCALILTGTFVAQKNAPGT